MQNYSSTKGVIFKSLFLSIFIIFLFANSASAAGYHCLYTDKSCIYEYKDEATAKAVCTLAGVIIGAGACPSTADKTKIKSCSAVLGVNEKCLAASSGGSSAATTDSAGCTVVNGITTCSLDNPLSSGATDINKIIGTVIKGVLGLVGALALFVFVQGGFTWLISRGNPEQVQKGSKTMLWAFAGLMLVFIAYGFLTFLLGLLEKGK